MADLIDPISRGWSRNIIEQTFWPINWDRIYATPIGDPAVDDRTVWHYSDNGKFTVKSCYQFLARTILHLGEEEGDRGVVWKV